MKEKIGTFMIAAILSSSCVYSARALRLIPEFRNQIQAQQSELSINVVDQIHRRWITPENSNMAFIPPPAGHPAGIVIYGPYYYDGPLDVLHLSELQKAPQSATPYKSLSDEEIVNWANSTK